ncbi:hypothetical protein LJ754_13650 [Arthrobacter sp. zg-Y40]|uniref:hypothetical protein n=1 Tax=Arthrobacter sp. zg-Y40 TaxID=2886939 RepID=UPI001D1465E5|nr:hypothetical protein [Arthrobacter sp. zg-Y40]MCC3280193.1 hypothetical protein [Arthrobacter sp. zg-Y40]
MPVSWPAKRWLTMGVVASAAAAVALTGMPAATAAGDYLAFSTDGTSFAPTLATPVFDQGIRLVPGSSTAGSIWIRNNGDGPAHLSAGAVRPILDPELAGLLSVSASADGIGGNPVLLGDAGACTSLYQGWELAPGEDVRVQLTADLSIEAPNAARNRSAAFDLVFYLQSTDIPGTGPDACEALDGSAGNPEIPASGGGTDNGTPGTGTGGNGVTGTDGVAPTPNRTGRIAALFQAGQNTPGAAAMAGFPAAAGEPGQVPGSTPNFNANVAPAEAGRLTDAAPAGFQSTVEPIIRSLSGTLLIVLSVAFFAAAGVRLRSRSQ